MATYVVDTAGVGGPHNADYASLQAAVDALLPLDEDTTIEVYASGGAADGPIDIPDMGNANVLTIRDPQQRATWDDTGYRVESENGGFFIYVSAGGFGQTARIIFENIQGRQLSQTADNQYGVRLNAIRTGFVEFRGCMLRGPGQNSYRQLFIHPRNDNQFDGIFRFINTIIYDVPTQATVDNTIISGTASDQNPSWTFFHNCTLIGGYEGMRNTGSIPERIQFRNCVYDFAGPADALTTAVVEDSILSLDDTSAHTHWSNVQMNTTLTFEDAANSDFRLAETDTEAIEQGADLSTNADAPVTYDKIGVSRPQGAAFDIGAFERELTIPDRFPRFRMGPKG